ncbi:MAG TPA: PIN domain-containing protein [Candidatus Binatia bacterium]|nr:PIN domain-containing protein [Candidatus Binatia bacterium]
MSTSRRLTLQKGRRLTAGGDVAGPVFVDSGAWLALAHARDGRHEEADRLFREAAGGPVPLITSNLVIAEVHRLLLFRAGPRVAGAFLDQIDKSRLLRLVFVTAAHHAAARAWLGRLAGEAITYTDAVSFGVMQAERCRAVLGFDRHFVAAGFELWR